MWELNEVLDLIRNINPVLMNVGWYVSLAGGVLINGKSEHDLDLVVVPLNKLTSDIEDVEKELIKLGWQKTHAVSMMHRNWRSKGLTDTKFVEAYSFNGKRIDIISPATA